MVWLWGLLCSCVYFTVATVDLKKCGDCTNREDIPCDIQEIGYPCPHAEFRDKWPGPPRSLKVQQVHSGDENWPWLANFTWKPPYDASISSLTGFFLNINTVMTEYGVVQLPKCFFANLSGTDWSMVEDPHSVVFHFDCIRAQMPTRLHMLLNSSPMPAEKAQGATASIVLNLETSAPAPSPINITYRTWGSKVKVDFGPIAEDTSYIVCLSQLRSEYSTCDQDINTTKSPVIFSDVKRDNYTIMIKPSTENQFFASKYFFVKGVPPKSYMDFSILLIILAGLIFVTMSTSIAFCVMRKQGKCVPKCLKRCKERSIYEKTPTNIPNNEGVDVCAICLDGESTHFLGAVSSVMSFLKKHGQCQIQGYWPVVCLENKDIEQMVETYYNKVLIIFHSENMVKFLKSYEKKTDMEELSAHKKFILTLLRHPKVKENCKTHVSFHNHNWAPLNDIKVLNMIKLVEGKMEPDVGINTEDVYQLLTKVSSVNVELTDSWSESSELNQVLTQTKSYLASTSTRKISVSRNILEDDQGYESHVPTENRNYPKTTDHHTTYREIPHSEVNLVRSGRENFNRTTRLHDTQQWADSQNQMRRGYGHQCCPAHTGSTAPQMEYHEPTGVTISDAYVSYRNGGHFMGNNNIPKGFQRETIWRTAGDERKELPPTEVGPQEACTIDWEPPIDDDTASISFSVICEKQQEIKEHYMQNLMSSGRI